MSKRRSIETIHYEERDALFAALPKLGRRDFLKVSAAAVAAAAASGVRFHPTSFQTVAVADAKGPNEGFTFAYISDSHLYKKELNDRFVRSLLRAVDDVNRLDPQPDFVLYGGDLAQLGQARGARPRRADPEEPARRPVRMMVGEHDWFLDMGEQLARALRRAHVLVRPQGRALRRPDERQREGLLDRARA